MLSSLKKWSWIINTTTLTSRLGPATNVHVCSQRHIWIPEWPHCYTVHPVLGWATWFDLRGRVQGVNISRRNPPLISLYTILVYWGIGSMVSFIGTTCTDIEVTIQIFNQIVHDVFRQSKVQNASFMWDVTSPSWLALWNLVTTSLCSLDSTHFLNNNIFWI